MDIVRNFKSMTAVQFFSLQIFEVVYVAALVFLPFVVASQVNVYAIIFIITIGIFVALFKRHTLRVVNPTGKTVLITSCDSGLGNACARHLVSRGFTVIAGCYDVGSEGACELKEADTGNLHIVKLDVTNEENIQQVILKMNNICHDKGLWALVNNACVSGFGSGEFSLDTDKNKINVNLTGTLKITEACLPFIKAAKGRVIMVTGSTGKVTVSGQSAICLSNSGLEVLSDSLRLELQPFGVKVITIKPRNLAGTSGQLNYILGLLHLTRSTSSSLNNVMDAMENAVRRQTTKSQVLVDGGN